MATDLYLIEFSRVPTNSPKEHPFWGVDMPLLVTASTGNLQVTATTVVDGGYQIKPKFEIKTKPSSGPQTSLFDIMNSGVSGVTTTFQELVSGAFLRYSLREDWTPTHTKAVLSVLTQILRTRANLNFERDITQFEGETLEFLDDAFFTFDNGPLLALFDDGSQLVDLETDFGSGSVVTPAIKRFSLANLGSEDATIRSIGITKGLAVFSTPTIPVTVLGPGESLEFDVTFAPDAALDFDGVLSIDSDLPGFNGQFELVGDGNPPNIPAISLSASFNNLVPFYNNLRGSRRRADRFHGRRRRIPWSARSPTTVRRR